MAGKLKPQTAALQRSIPHRRRLLLADFCLLVLQKAAVPLELPNLTVPV